MTLSLNLIAGHNLIPISLMIGSLSYFCLKWSLIFSYWKSRNIKNPTPFPVFGNSLKMFFKPRPQIEMNWYHKYGKIFGIFIGPKPALTVAEPELIKQIMVKDFYLFRNRRDKKTQNKFLSKIIFFSKDDDWKRIRTITSPTFSSGKLKKIYSLINKCCNNFIIDLEQRVDTQNEIELKQLMGNYTMDVIARCAFATDTNTYKDDNNEFNTRAYNFFNPPLWRMMIVVVLSSLPWSSKLRSKIAGIESIVNFFANYAANLMKHRRNNNEKHNDFLQLLMDAKRSDGETTDEIDANEALHVSEGAGELNTDKKAFINVLEKKLTENEILAQCFSFVITGFETVATTLSYCIYELAINPEIQERLREETREAFDEKGEMKYGVISKLPFLGAVISETLRSYPPMLRLDRVASEDVMLGNSGIKIERGVITEIPVYAIHHDQNNFPQPFSFKPERFMPENRNNIKPYTYLPFGAGPRNCIGMQFALFEMKLALTKLTQKFKFLRVSGTDVPVIFNKGRNILQAKRLTVGIKKR